MFGHEGAAGRDPEDEGGRPLVDLSAAGSASGNQVFIWEIKIIDVK